MQAQIVYDKHFLLWWGRTLLLCQRGSRRQRDYQLNTDGPQVLANLNRLAGTQQTTRPVHKTRESFVGRRGSAPLAGLDQKMVQRLIRLQGRFLVRIDGSGSLVFPQRPCEPCLTQQHGETTGSLHQVLEAKVLGPGGTVCSSATECIDNRDAQDTPADARPERRQQDGEWKALPRLGAQLRAAFPHLRICRNGDSQFACGPGFQVAKDHHGDYLEVFQPGRTPALGQDFQGLLPLCPQQRGEGTTPQQTQQVDRWIKDLESQDSEGRPWQFHALQGQQTTQAGAVSEGSWLTPLRVDRDSVVEVAQRGGRQRGREEHEGLNTQKNRGLNLEHACSHKCWAAYSFWLPIAPMRLQLVEKGRLLRPLAQQQGKATAVAWFGSLKNRAPRLRESLRYRTWEDEAFDVVAAAPLQLRLDSS